MSPWIRRSLNAAVAGHLEGHGRGAQQGSFMIDGQSSDLPAIQVENLTKIYGSGNTKVVAMKDATLSVKKGEVVALLGSNGAGKSTLLTAMGLINAPTSGRVVIGGVPVMDGSAALDSHRGRQVMELFCKAAHERGSGVIVVTHDRRALDIFDRTFEMEDGVISGQGSSHEDVHSGHEAGS